MRKIEDIFETIWNKNKNKPLVAFLFQRKLSIGWIAAVIIVCWLGYEFQGKVAMFQGVAEATETIISVPAVTEVIDVHVMPGQEIHAGDTIVELNRPDLTLRISEVTRELDMIEGRSSLNSAEINQRVASIKADLAARASTLRSEINRLETEYKKNKEISAKLKSLSTSNMANSSDDAMEFRIKSLKDELALAQRSANEQIALLQGSKKLQKASGQTEAETLRKELEELKKQEEELIYIAKEDWVVGDVLAHDGEKVSSFAPIVTLTHKAPTLIRGYINEQVYQNLNTNKNVRVYNLSGKGRATEGEIIGLSSRIVELPPRMWKMPDMPVYGREVIVRIPEDNPFLLGEMVLISEK